MNFDYFVILLIWIVSIAALIVVLPGPKIREYLAVFLFMQGLTWIFSIALTDFDNLKTDIRIFQRATEISFTSEFMFYPTIAVLFHGLFPKHDGKIRVALHYLLFVGATLLYLFLLGRFTNIMKLNYTLLVRAFFNFTFELWVTRRYIIWLTSMSVLQKKDEVRL